MENYFDLYDLPLSFELDTTALTKKYYELNKLYHPDKFTLASDTEKEAALQKSTAINKGYKILKKQQPRLKHILALLGSAPEEGKETMSQDFLMEMMEVNEAIMDYKMEPTEEAQAQIKALVSEFQTEVSASYTEATKNFDFQNPDPAKTATLKGIYLKNKYLKRLLDNLEDRGVEL